MARDSEQSAAQVAQKILRAIDLLVEQPHLGRPGRIVGIRELVVPGTQYLIPYRIRSEMLEFTRCSVWEPAVAG